MKSFGHFCIIIGMSLLFSFLPWAVAQQGGQGGGNTGGTGGTTPKNVPSPPPTVPTPPGSQTPSQQPIPPLIFISGSVMQDDGTPPPFGAVIELECGNSVTRQATVDLNGHFSFQVGDKNRLGQVLPDASEGTDDTFSAQMGTRNPFGSPMPSTIQTATMQTSPLGPSLMGCELRAQLAGYRSSTLRLDSTPFSGQNEVGSIVIYPIERVRGSAVSATSMLAPKAAKKSMERAKKDLQKEKFDEAETLLKSAVEAYPKYGEAWFELGQLYFRQHHNDEARNAYAKAIESDSLYASPYVRLGWIASVEKKWQEAADFTDKALSLDPMTFPDAYFLNALANYNLDNMVLAEKRAHQEQRLDSGHQFPQTYMILANISARKNDTEGSIEEMRNYLKYAPNASDAASVRSLLQQKEKLAKAAGK